MGKRTHQVARELGVPVQDVRDVMADLGLYLSAATPLTEEQIRSIASRLEASSLESPAGEDRSDTDS